MRDVLDGPALMACLAKNECKNLGKNWILLKSFKIWILY